MIITINAFLKVHHGCHGALCDSGGFMGRGNAYDIMYRIIVIMDSLNMSDPEHPIVVDDIIDLLDKNDTQNLMEPCSRRTVNQTMKELCLIDDRIVHQKGNKYGRENRWHKENLFAPFEVKLFIDCIEKSLFLTKNQKATIISKVLKHATVTSKEMFGGHLSVKSKYSSEDEKAIQYVNTVFKAVYSGKKLRFKYLDFIWDKTRAFRKDGRFYVVNPYFIVYDHNTFYVICGMDGKEGFANYRIDRMRDVEFVNEERSVASWYRGNNLEQDLVNDAVHTVDHFGGERIKIILEVEKESRTAFNILNDEIGHEHYYVLLHDIKDKLVQVVIEVNYSPTVQNWLWEYADYFMPVGPEIVCRDYEKRLEKYYERWQTNKHK